jgi:hypothetical protein
LLREPPHAGKDELHGDRPGGAVTVRRNRVHWFNHEGTPNPYWNGGGFTEVTEAENRFGDATVLSEVPKPPSVAPMPPRPAVSADGVVRLPWVP